MTQLCAMAVRLLEQIHKRDVAAEGLLPLIVVALPTLSVPIFSLNFS